MLKLFFNDGANRGQKREKGKVGFWEKKMGRDMREGNTPPVAGEKAV
jgi:hypothetical protein